MQEPFWWWQCSDRYIISLCPHLPTLFPHFSPSLLSLMVSVDIKHHVYLLTSETDELVRQLITDWRQTNWRQFWLMRHTRSDTRSSQDGGGGLLAKARFEHATSWSPAQCLTTGPQQYACWGQKQQAINFTGELTRLGWDSALTSSSRCLGPAPPSCDHFLLPGWRSTGRRCRTDPSPCLVGCWSLCLGSEWGSKCAQ